MLLVLLQVRFRFVSGVCSACRRSLSWRVRAFPAPFLLLVEDDDHKASAVVYIARWAFGRNGTFCMYPGQRTILIYLVDDDDDDVS